VDVRLTLVLAGWVVGWWLLWRVPRLDDPDAGADPELDGRGHRPTGGAAPATSRTGGVSVVIPARNEATSLGILLRSLALQDDPADEVIVVDDQSDDDTAAIARSFPGVTVVAGQPLPPGWTGKAWACHQGVAAARGATLVFVDADVSLASTAIGHLRSVHAAQGGLVSVQPFHTMRRAYERLSAVFNVIGIMGVGAASPGRRARAHAAFGPCLITSRADYTRVGGHLAVRHEIVEDIALAHGYQRAGLAVHCYGGGADVRFRMYPDGPGQLLEGWSKNIATGAGSVGIPRLLLVGFWVTTVLISIQFVIEQSFGHVDVALPQIVLIYAMFAIQLAAMLRQLGNFTVFAAACYPALFGVFLLVFVHSAYLTLVRRKVMWRGRSIALGATAARQGDADAVAPTATAGPTSADPSPDASPDASPDTSPGAPSARP